MFLDEQLLQTCRDYSGTNPEDIQNLNKSLCKQCELYYKSKIKPTSNDCDVRVILDRTFNLWDSFVRMAVNDDNKVIIE